jgi:hypothetical protein
VADETRDLMVRIRGDAREGVEALKKTERASRQLEREFGKLRAQIMKGKQSKQESKVSFTELNQAVELVKTGLNALQGVANTTFQALDRGQMLNNLSLSFDQLKASSGAQSITLDKLQQSTQGLVSNTELLRQANQAMVLGLPGDQLDEVFEATIRVSRAMGVDATRGIESFVTGTARQSRLMLDNIGIMISAEDAYVKFAEANDRSVDSLTELEKKTAFTNLAIEKLKENAEKVAETQLNAADQATIFRISLENAFDTMGRGAANNEALADTFSDINEILGEIDFERLGDSLATIGATLANLVVPFVENFADALSTVADVVAIVENKTKDWNIGLGETAGWLMPGGIIIKGLGMFKEEAREAREELEAQLPTMEELTQILERDLLAARRRLAREEQEALREQKRLQQEVNKEVQELQKAYEEAAQEIRINDIKSALEDAAEAADEVKFTKLGDELREEIKKKVLAGLEKAAGDPGAQREAEKLADLLATAQISKIETDVAEANRKAAEKQAKEVQDSLEEAYKNSTDFWEDILIGAVEGNISDVLENMLTRAAIKFGAEMLASLTGSFAGLSSIGLLGGGIGSGGGLGGVGAGVGLGAGAGGIGTFLSNPGGFFAGLTGASQAIPGVSSPAVLAGASAAQFAGIGAGALVGLNQFTGLQSAASGGSLSLLEQGALALPTFGASFLFNPISSAFGSGKSGAQRQRDAFRAHLQETGLIDDNFLLPTFGGNTFDFGDDSPFRTGNVSAGGSLLATLTGGSEVEGIASGFTAALESAGSFNAQLITTENLINQVAGSTQNAEAILLQAYANEQISLQQLNQQMELLSILGSEGARTVAEEFDLLAEVIDGPPRDAMRALERAFQSARESGAQDVQALLSIVEQELGTEAVAIFQNMANAGIDQFTDLNQLSSQQITFLFNNIAELSTVLEGVGTAGREAGSEIASGAAAGNEELRKARLEAIRLKRELDSIKFTGDLSKLQGAGSGPLG